MTLPEKALPQRRRQILDDETGTAHRFNVSRRQDTSQPEDPLHGGTFQQDTFHQDNWTSNFVDRLAGLIRKLGGNNQT
jgi:hypothetical protein